MFIIYTYSQSSSTFPIFEYYKPKLIHIIETIIYGIISILNPDLFLCSCVYYFCVDLYLDLNSIK
jgi:hypothetical protein